MLTRIILLGDGVEIFQVIFTLNVVFESIPKQWKKSRN